MFSKSKLKNLGWAAVTSLSLFTSVPRAQDSSASIQDLDQKIRILERKLEVQDETALNKVPEPKLTAGDDGFSLKSGDGNYILKWRGLLQADYRGFVGDTNSPDAKALKDSSYTDPGDYTGKTPKVASTFLLRKVRPVFEATLFKYYTFRVVPDFGGGTFALQDAYAEANFWPEFKLRLGKFTPPISLERLQSSSDNNFVEYNYAAALAPSRDMGAQISGDLFEEIFHYDVGYFNGAEDGVSKDNDLTNHKDLAARVFVQPFKKIDIGFLNNLGVGVAGTWGEAWGDSVNFALPSIRSAGQNTIFSYSQNKAKGLVGATGSAFIPAGTILDSNTVRAAGDRSRFNPEAYWYAGSFSLFGEFISSSLDVARSRPIRDTTGGVKTLVEGDFATLTNKAWGASASWVVTGEPTSFKGVKPRHAFSPDGSGIGAIEIVARAGQFLPDEKTFEKNFYADTTASVRKATSFGAGVNWYLSKQVKWLLDYEHTAFEQGAMDAAGKIKDRDDEDVVTARFQVNF